MTKKGKELHEEVKEKIERTTQEDTFEKAFTDFWRLACFAKNTTYDVPHLYEGSSKEFVDKHKEQLADMRREVLKNLNDYVQQTMEKMEKNKIKVYYAKTNEDAQQLLLEEIGEEKTIYKSKSNEAKDIGLLEFLKEQEIEVKETDLGDVFIQLFEYELPTYQVGPGLHFETDEIVAKIKEKYGEEVEPKASEIVNFFRRTYRKKLLNDVKVSLTSANAISAEDGCIVLLENEGNISLITRSADKHIVVVGINKIVPSVFDALLVTKMIERTNNAEIAYISLIYGPSGTSDIKGLAVEGMYGAKEVVVILVDEWRMRAVQENLFYKDFLRCISCKSCSFVCPASRAFGNTYASQYGLGGIAILRDYIHHGIESAVKDGLFLCTGCENCHEWCPADVNIAECLRTMKKEATEKGLAPPTMENYKKKIYKEKDPFRD